MQTAQASAPHPQSCPSVLRLPANPLSHRISVRIDATSSTNGCPFPRPQLPDPNQKSSPHRSHQKHRYRSNPRHIVEASANRSRQHGRPILRRKPVQYRRIRPATRHLLPQLPNHPVGVRTAHVVALQQHLRTPAYADHLVPKPVEPRRIAGPQHHNTKYANRRRLHPSLKHGAPQPPPAPQPLPAPELLPVSGWAPEPQTCPAPRSPPQSRSSPSENPEIPC